jgi:hypothetical protein
MSTEKKVVSSQKAMYRIVNKTTGELITRIYTYQSDISVDSTSVLERYKTYYKWDQIPEVIVCQEN